MIRTGRVLAASALLMMGAGVAAAAEQAADRLAQALSSYSTFQAAFTQVVSDEQGRVMQESSGDLKARRPGLFYWKTDPPANQIIVSDGKTVELYDPDLEQVTVQTLDDQMSSTPALLLSGETDGLSENYEITEARYGDSTREYTLVPRNEDSLFIALTLVFHNDELQAMRLEDSLAQLTELEFGNIRINEPVPMATFELDYPDSVDVIQGVQ